MYPCLQVLGTFDSCHSLSTIHWHITISNPDHGLQGYVPFRVYFFGLEEWIDPDRDHRQGPGPLAQSEPGSPKCKLIIVKA